MRFVTMNVKSLFRSSTYSSALETDLKIEREWRSALQSNLEQEKELVSQLHVETHKLKDTTRVCF